MAIELIRASHRKFRTGDDVGVDTMKLEPGDRVAVIEHGYLGKSAKILTVERVTRTQLVMKGWPSRFLREDGSRIGSGGWSRDLYPTGHPDVIDALQATAMRALRKKLDEALVNCGKVDADGRIELCRDVEAFAREARAHLQKLQRQGEAWALEAEKVLEATPS